MPFSSIDYPKYWHEVALEKAQRSLEAMEDGVLVFNCELIDVARRNANAALNFANRVSSAKSPAEIFALQLTHSWTQFGALLRQAEELRALAMAVITDIVRASAVSRAPEPAWGSNFKGRTSYSELQGGVRRRDSRSYVEN